jgi:hypothetical protein
MRNSLDKNAGVYKITEAKRGRRHRDMKSKSGVCGNRKTGSVHVMFFSFTGTGPVSSGICASGRHRSGISVI